MHHPRARLAASSRALSAVPALHCPALQAEGKGEDAALGPDGREPGEEPTGCEDGATGTALGVGAAAAVDYPGGTYWALPAAPRIAMLHALVNDVLECGELRCERGRTAGLGRPEEWAA